MRKLLISMILSLFAFSTASAEVGVKVGVSGQLGLFAASATEKDKGTHGTTTSDDETAKASEHLAIGYASIFVEKSLGDRLSVGIDYVPEGLDTETTETRKYDKTTTDSQASVENKIAASFEDMTTLYVNVNLTDNFYLKAGYTTVDIITEESLGTGSKYGNTDTSGAVAGFGYNSELDNGMFVRAEATYADFDSVSITSDTGVNTISVNNLHGVTGRVSVGKTF